MKARIGWLLMSMLPLNAAFAADDWPRFEIRAAGYITDINADMNIDSSTGGSGSNIDLEDELGIEDGLEELRLDFRWRFAPRHAVDFAYYDISRDGQHVIERQLDIGDETYDIGTDLNSSIDFKVYKASYAYSFSHTEKSDAALSIGLHIIDLGVAFKGDLIGIPVNRYSADVALPLPVVGGQYARHLGGRFWINLDVDLFAIEYEDYKGSLWDANLTLDIDITDSIGGFIGYNYVDMSVESEDPSLLGEFDYRYGAVTAGFRLTF
jgi:hypothetical protein